MVTRATRFIHAAAERMKASGVTVDCDSRMETVCISCDGEEDIFMQGDEAACFIKGVEDACKKYPSLTSDIAELWLAHPYAENIWS